MHRLLEHCATGHLLNWIEVVDLIGRGDIAFSSLEASCRAMVCNVVETHYSECSRRIPEQDRTLPHAVTGIVRELFYDGRRFIQRNMEII